MTKQTKDTAAREAERDVKIAEQNNDDVPTSTRLNDLTQDGSLKRTLQLQPADRDEENEEIVERLDIRGASLGDRVDAQRDKL